MWLNEVYEIDFDEKDAHGRSIWSEDNMENEEVEIGSSCCFAKVWQPDWNGHGKCLECGENCETVGTDRETVEVEN